MADFELLALFLEISTLAPREGSDWGGPAA